MSAMTRTREQCGALLLDPDLWEAPIRLSNDDLYAETGADRRVRGHPFDEREDER